MGELTKQFGVRAITIRRVLRDLTENGYLLTSQGARTTVADRRKREHCPPLSVLCYPFEEVAIHSDGQMARVMPFICPGTLEQLIVNRNYGLAITEKKIGNLTFQVESDNIRDILYGAAC